MQRLSYEDDPPEGTEAIVQIGTADDLTPETRARSVRLFHKLVERHAKWIAFVIGGYDDDPRELWEIPEVIAYVVEWLIAADLRTAEQARAANVTEQTIQWMGACLEAAYHTRPLETAGGTQH
jgi:hypothetical protein